MNEKLTNVLGKRNPLCCTDYINKGTEFTPSNSNLPHAECVTRCECRCPRHLRRVFGASRASATKRLWSCKRRRLRGQCSRCMTAISSQIHANQCIKSLGDFVSNPGQGPNHSRSTVSTCSREVLHTNLRKRKTRKNMEKPWNMSD